MPDIIQFKRGSLSSFNTLATQNASSTTGVYESGAFYFVEDTNRLYLAKTKKTIVDLNQYVHVVDSTSDLYNIANPVDGDMYYVKGANILAYYDSQSDSTNHWVQMNPDTALATSAHYAHPSSFTITGQAGQTGVEINQGIRDTKGNEFVTAFNIVAGNSNINISTTAGNTIVLTPADQSANTTYALSVPTSNSDAVLSLNGNDASTSVVAFAHADDVTITGSTEGGIPTITIGGVHNVAGLTQTFDNSGILTTEIVDAGGSTLASATMQPVISYGATTATASDASFESNGKVYLNVYTKAQIDSLIEATKQEADALKYMGTIGDATTAASVLFTPATAVSGKYQGNMGDTYKVSEDFTYNNVEYKAGDLIIAGDVANGDTDGAVTWTRIPAGDEPVLEFQNTVSTSPAIAVSDGASTVGGIIFVPDSRIGTSAISYNASEDSSTNQLEVEIRHGAAGTGTAITPSSTITQNYITNSNVTATFVTGLSLDQHGHVATATLASVSFTDTHARLDTIAQSITATSTTSSVAYEGILGLDGANSGQTFIELDMKSDNLTIIPLTTTAAGAAVSVADNTKVKPTVKINMEWGSF